jgi:type III pantothenate kinase
VIRIVADLGNTRLKCGVLDDRGAIAHSAAWPAENWKVLAENLRTLDVDWSESTWAVSSVNPPLKRRLEDLFKSQKVSRVSWFTSGEDVRVKTLNQENDKAGADRALAVSAAIRLMPRNETRFVVCCGTAITVERIGADDVWHGGAIAPGLRLIATALAQGTAQLPEIDFGGLESPVASGTTTLESIRGGVLWFAAGGVRKLLDRQAAEVGAAPELIVFTGGDADKIAPLAVGPGAWIVPELVLLGLAFEAFGIEPARMHERKNE